MTFNIDINHIWTLNKNLHYIIFNLQAVSPNSSFFFFFFVGSLPIMFLQVAQASYNNNEKPDQSAVLG